MWPSLERILDNVPTPRCSFGCDTKRQRLLGGACCVALVELSTIVSCKTAPREAISTSARAVGDDHPPGHARASDRPVQLETYGMGFCVRLESGRVACWGDNRHGQLGDGTTLAADGIVVVAGVDDADLLLRNAMCVRTKAADTICWGRRACPNCERVRDGWLWRLSDVTDVSRELEFGRPCFVTTDQAVHCLVPEKQPPAGLPPVRAVHEAHVFVCGEQADRTLSCWWVGQDSGTDFFQPPLPSSDIIALGRFHLCVVSDDQRVLCWGDRVRSGYAVPEPATPPHHYGPVAVIEGLDPQRLAAGDDATCVATGHGHARCWGRVRSPVSRKPEFASWEVELDGVITDLAVGTREACALLDDGTVWVWPHGATDSGAVVPTRVVGLPVTDEPAGVPPRTTATELREALRWSGTPRRLAAITALDRGLVLGDVHAGSWHHTKTACFAEHLVDTYVDRTAGSWSCDRELTRCVAQRSSDATVFGWVDAADDGRRLVAVTDYEGSAPSTDPGALEHALQEAENTCPLWRALSEKDEDIIGDTVTVLTHPATVLDDQPAPVYRHYCGSVARRVAREHFHVDPMAQGWECTRLECSYNMSQGARGIFVFRLDAAGRPKLWVTGVDFDPAFDPTTRPLMHDAISRAERHTCP
jgi:hypothetical protein